MIGVQSPSGKKGLILRGVLTPAGKKGIAQGSILTPDGDRVFWDGSLAALSVNINPTYATGGIARSSPATITTNTVTASAGGGSPPYTFAWTFEETDGGEWSITAPNSATTAFRCASVGPGVMRQATARCTVTDARGATGFLTIFPDVVNYGGIIS